MANFSVNVKDIDKETEVQGVRYFVKLHNKNLSGEDKLAIRPLKALKKSYEQILATTLEKVHAKNLSLAASHSAGASNIQKRWRLSSDAQRAAALEALANPDEIQGSNSDPELGSVDDPSTAPEPSVD